MADREEQQTLHPRDTMDDITEVTSASEVAKKNTIPITKSGMEIRDANLIAGIFGFVAGILLFFIFQPVIGMLPSAGLVVLSTVAAPFLFVPKDELGIKRSRFKDLMGAAKSKDVKGNLYFVASPEPVDLGSVEVDIFQA